MRFIVKFILIMEVMTVCGSWILCVGALLASPVRSELSILGCEAGSVDVVEGTDQLFTCGEYWTTGPQWTVYDDEGRQLYSGSCYRRSCTPWNDQFQLYEVYHEKSYKMFTSRLTIKNITRDSARQVVCSNSWPRASCNLRIITPAILKDCNVIIRDWHVQATCVAEQMYASDGRYSCRWRVNNVWLTSNFQDSLTEYSFNTRVYRKGVCSYIHTMPNSLGNYTYSIKIDPGVWNTVKTLYIVPPEDPMYTCSDIVQEGSTVSCNCTSSNPGTPPATFFWNRWSSDILYVYNVQREQSGNKYTCSMTWGPNNIRRQAVLTLTVLVPVSINTNSCSVQLSGWNVSGVCTVQWLSSIKTPTCNWILKSKEKTQEIPGVQSKASYKSTDPFDYINCSFVHQMPVITGNYTYSIDVSSHPADQFSKSLYLEKPDAPQHNCPKIFLEGSNVTCTCFTSNLGTPRAQIGWAESSKEHFVIEGINRERNGTVTTCSLTWGSIHSTTLYTILVAFGPSVTYIISNEETSGDETKTVLVCTASDVYPSAFFRWNISCENETNSKTTSMCTLPTSPVADQKTIECTASNQMFEQVSSTTIYVLKPTQNPYQRGVLAGSVVAVLLLVVIVAVIILFIKRRKVINKPETQTTTVRFAAPSGDIYTIAGTTTGDHREDEYVTVRDTTCPNNILQLQTPVVRFAAPSGDLYSIAGPVTAREVNPATMEGATGRMQHILPCHPTKNTTYNNNQGTESKKMPIKPTRLGGKNRHHWSSKAEFDNKVDTQRPAAHFAAPSGDLYAIAGPATAGEDKPVTGATSNTSYTPKSSSAHKASDITNMTNKGMDSKKMAIKPKPTRFGKQSRQDVPVTGYMNVTEVPTDSGLGVYHVVPWAAKSETGSSDARVLDTSTISEDEYNVLRFQEDRTGQEDHDVTYSHLNIK